MSPHDWERGVCRLCGADHPNIYAAPLPFGDALRRAGEWHCPERARLQHVEAVRARRAENGLARG